MKRIWFTAALIGALLAVPLLVRAGNESAVTYKALSFFGDAYQLIRDNYVEPVNDEKLVAGALNGMLSSLDPHSSYMDPETYREMQVETKGEFGGLGMEVSLKDGLIEIVSPIDDTPASQAGLKAGDVILRIDGEAVLGLNLSQAVEKLRGPENSTVKLTIRRGSQAPFEVRLTRKVIKAKPIHDQLYGKIGYIRIALFSEQTQKGVELALERLQRQAGGRLQGLLLDLRDDPGGLLDQAVVVGGDFLSSGEIVSTRGRRAQDDQRYYAHGGDLAKGVPMVVLINGGTASASEIVAGALRDNHRAVVMGTRSFGKGTVQTIIPIEGRGAIRLTTARYYTPSGKSIQDVGIEPDVVVHASKADEAKEAQQLRESDLPRALKNPDAPPPAAAERSAVSPGKTAETGAPAAAGEDYQLAQALDYLRGQAAQKRGKTP
ncbi:MAG: S41 family peptidase [Alphaproteobacteria bacterium]